MELSSSFSESEWSRLEGLRGLLVTDNGLFRSAAAIDLLVKLTYVKYLINVVLQVEKHYLDFAPPAFDDKDLSDDPPLTLRPTFVDEDSLAAVGGARIETANSVLFDILISSASFKH